MFGVVSYLRGITINEEETAWITRVNKKGNYLRWWL